MGQWTSPPTRRELSLLLFCVTIFIIAYNADASLRLVGLDASVLPFSSYKPAPIGPDGRRLAPYRDKLEAEIFGEWDWEEGRVAGAKTAEAARLMGKKGKGDVYVHGEGVTGREAMWLQGVGEGKYGLEEGMGTTNVNDDFVRWGEDVPRTTLVQHIPGFTILDNVLFAFGTFFLVTDDPSSMPDVSSVASSIVNHTEPPRDIDWQVLPHSNALNKLGPYGGRIHGVTFMSYDTPAATDSHTLLSLQRLYSTIDPTSAPHRLLFSSIPTFSDRKPEPDDDTIVRQRSSLGIHPYLLKSAYPSLAGPLFSEDFDDFVGMGAPMVLDRLVVADRGAARRHGAATLPPWAPPFSDLHAPTAWFEPVRHNLAGYFGVQEEGARRHGYEVTYLAQQAGLGGAKLRDADHQALLDALKRLRGEGVTVHIINESTGWTERMRAILRSTMVLGVYGEHLSDSVFMKPSPHAMLIELFPSGAFTRDWEIVVRSMGIRYVGFQGEQKFTSEALPAVSNPSSLQDIHIDAKAIVAAINDELARRV
ncbi:hypothetical protein BV25DRAFT_1898814 [Artomyces pyxidatus]|uniref:Uncharacterized protein n=1 Tax=Artomyces pyxidatus TaxID=48021 RepID=A0ACB8T7C2_9AGAM|nr:hypothetical protein BV25DRAFT_1898814 [Artomyces pyxidatus]